jgi:DNA polymerase (family X)
LAARSSPIPGIGEDLAAKIQEIVRTGTTSFLAKLEEEVPEGVVRMLDIPTVGPKSAKLFYETLKVRTLEDLEQAARAGRLLALPGVKEKTVENIL